MSHRVSIQSAVKTYGNFNAVDNISLDIQRGELFTLLGPSGCGKTTLLRMIAGFNSIDGGKICFDDQEINNIPAHARNVGMVFQNYAIFPHMTVRQNVEYGLKARKIKGESLQTRTQKALEMMHIAEYADRLPSKLSGGQQQRVALARAIVIEPKILLMDEPLSNLDAKLRVEMRTSIRRIQKELGITTVYVTHDQEEALAISDRIAVFNRGKVEQVGGPIEIYTRPANAFVSNFIGSSTFLEAEISRGQLLLLGRYPLTRQLTTRQGKAMVAVRPEHVLLGDPSADTLGGTIELVSFLGDFINYEIRLPNDSIIEANAYTKDMQQLRQAGQQVSLSFMEDAISIYDHEGKGELT